MIIRRKIGGGVLLAVALVLIYVLSHVPIPPVERALVIVALAVIGGGVIRRLWAPIGGIGEEGEGD